MGVQGKDRIRTLFICYYNRKRSATAERLFSRNPALDVRSAGTSDEAMVQVNQRMLDWADVVFIMEDEQRRELTRLFPKHPALERLICLEIPDKYEFLDPELVTLLQERTAPHLERILGG
jgi:predicted protein tyrosine phosphatase